MVKSKTNEIQRLTNLIGANISISKDHPEMKEKLDNENEGLKNQIEELKKVPVKNSKVIIDSNQENAIVGKCKSNVMATGKPCTHDEVSDGYCLVHLKQRDPEKAEKYRIENLKNKFGLTDNEIEEIKKVNGTLNNVNKALAEFIKSGRVKI